MNNGITVDTTNLAAGTYNYELYMQTFNNIILQYKLISGAVDNTLTMKLYGTVYDFAIVGSVDDWVDVTELFSESTSISVNNSTATDLLIADTNCPFLKLKIEVVVTATTPDNTVKIGYNTNR